MHVPGELARQLERLRTQRPYLQTVLPGLEDVCETAASAAAEFAAAMPELPSRLVTRDPDLPLLDDDAVQNLAPWLRESTERMAASVTALYGTAAVTEWLLGESSRPAEAALAMLHFDGPSLVRMAQEAGVPVNLFALAVRDCVAPVFMALGTRLAAMRAQELQGKGWCPVCGQNPCLATLGKANFDTSFLASSGGQRELHCSLCDTSWRVRKGLCPACGVEHGSEEHPEGKRILNVENVRRERLEWCSACTSYIPCLDLRELDTPPATPVALFSLMHLDVAAQEQGLTPVTPTLFNMLARMEHDKPTESLAHETLS
ncbi:formate dehydrogenase accessory protein FdhE [Megalodesulfovibrio paquesii]